MLRTMVEGHNRSRGSQMRRGSWKPEGTFWGWAGPSDAIVGRDCMQIACTRFSGVAGWAKVRVARCGLRWARMGRRGRGLVWGVCAGSLPTFDEQSRARRLMWVGHSRGPGL